MVIGGWQCFSLSFCQFFDVAKVAIIQKKHSQIHKAQEAKAPLPISRRKIPLTLKEQAYDP